MWVSVKKSEDAQIAIRGINWAHSFIREAHLISPSYILPDSIGTVAPDYPPSARVFVSSASKRASGLELLFVDVVEFNVGFHAELKPSVTVEGGRIFFKFHDNHHPIIAMKLFYRFLGSDTWGYSLRYGWEDIYSKEGLLSFESIE